MFAIKKLRDQTGFLYKATADLASIYGPVVGLKVGKDRQVVCYGYQAIKEMLTKEEINGRPQGPFYETRTWGLRRGLFISTVYIHCTLYKLVSNTRSLTRILTAYVRNTHAVI